MIVSPPGGGSSPLCVVALPAAKVQADSRAPVPRSRPPRDVRAFSPGPGYHTIIPSSPPPEGCSSNAEHRHQQHGMPGKLLSIPQNPLHLASVSWPALLAPLPNEALSSRSFPTYFYEVTQPTVSISRPGSSFGTLGLLRAGLIHVSSQHNACKGMDAALTSLCRSTAALSKPSGHRADLRIPPQQLPIPTTQQ